MTQMQNAVRGKILEHRHGAQRTAEGIPETVPAERPVDGFVREKTDAVQGRGSQQIQRDCDQPPADAVREGDCQSASHKGSGSIKEEKDQQPDSLPEINDVQLPQ